MISDFGFALGSDVALHSAAQTPTQVVTSKDAMAQQYLLDCVIQVRGRLCTHFELSLYIELAAGYCAAGVC